MPNIKSAEKHMRSDAKKHARNQAAVTELKTLWKKLTVLEKEPDKAEEFSRLVISRYDRAVSRGIIPRGRADRKKSRIAEFLKRVNQTSKK